MTSNYVVRRSTPRQQPPGDEPTLSGDLLRQVAEVQHDKTLLAVRDLVEKVAVSKKGGRNDWDTLDRTAQEFRADLLKELRAMGQGA